jgi:hypothetical protein
LASGLAVGTAALLSPAAFADTIVAHPLNGTVDPVFAITWSGPPATFVIPAAGADQTLGDVGTTANAAYKIQAKSANASVLIGEAPLLNTDTIAYTLTFNDVSGITPNAAGNVTIFDSVASTASITLPLTLQTLSTSGKPFGTYTDLLTLTISSNL